jgi:hypothetical protein
VTATRRYRTLALVLLAVIGWAVLFRYVPADAIADYIGRQHVYAAAFLLALVAGFSSLTGSAAYAAIIGFARAGADPLLLGISGGIGLFLSDSAFYFLIMRGRIALEGHFTRLLARTQSFIERVPAPVVYAFIYLFAAFGPIPNDVMLAALVLAGYAYRRFWPALLMGDITFALFLSYLFRQ